MSTLGLAVPPPTPGSHRGKVTTRYPGELRAPTWRSDAWDALACVIAIGLLVLVYGQWAGPGRLFLSLGFTFFVPGRAVVTHWPRMARWSEAAMSMVFSLAILTLLAMITLWAGTWHPVALFEAEAWLSLAALGAGSARRTRRGQGVAAHPAERRRPGPQWHMVAQPRAIRQWLATDLQEVLRNRVRNIRALSATQRAGADRGVPWPFSRYTDILLPLAVALWALGVSHTDVRALNLYGLPAVLPVVYYAGIALFVASAGFELTRRRPSSWRIAAHAGVLVVMLYGTAPLVYSQGRYSWLYKTIGVVQYVNAHGTLNSSIDIYQNWSGFFALAAWFGKVAGVSSALSYAKWSQLVVELAALPLLYLIYTALPLTPRQRWVALLLYAASNWIAQDYFSPQSLSTLLSLGIMAIAIRWLSIGQYLDRQPRRRVPADDDTGPNMDTRVSYLLMRPRFICVTICLLYFVLTFTHELSPYILAIQLGALAVFKLVRPRWLPALLAAIAVAFLLPHFTFVNQKYGLLQSFGDFFSNAGPPSASSGPISPVTQLFAQRTADVLSAGMWVLAAVGAWLRRREGRNVLALVLLAYSSAAVLALQAYGQEGILRVYLFSLPWCAALAALAIVPTARSGATSPLLAGSHGARWFPAASAIIGRIGRPIRRTLRLPADGLAPSVFQVQLALAVVLALFFPAFFGDDSYYRMPSAEVATITAFQRHAVSGPLYAAINNGPFNDTYRYNLFPIEGIFGDNSMLGSEHATPQIADVIADVAARQTGGKKPAYVIVAPSMAAYTRAYPAVNARDFSILLRSLARSPQWTLVASHSGTVIYELSPLAQAFIPHVPVPPSASRVLPAVP